MNNAEFELHVIPTESRVAQSETNSYTLRLPMAMLLEQDPNLVQVIADTGNVAFGHNKPESKTVVVKCPEGASHSVEWVRTALRQFDVHIRAKQWKRFTSMADLKGCSLGCVDRRLDDTGVDTAKNGQITQAGGPLVLHPNLTDEMPAAHRANLLRAMEYAAEMGAPVGSMNYHFGSEGASGCGMYGLLSRSNSRIQAALNSPRDVVDMMKMVRDRHAKILKPDTEITGAVLLGRTGDSVTYNLDDPDDVKDLLSERDLVL